MICKKCNNEISNNAKFCKYCGERLDTSSSQQIIEQSEVSATNDKVQVSNDKVKKLKSYFNNFLQYTIETIKSPISSKENHRSRLTNKEVYTFLSLITFISSLFVLLQVKGVEGKVWSINLGFFSLGDLLNEIGYSLFSNVIIYYFISHIVLCMILSLISWGTYQYMFKKDFKFADGMRVMLNASIVLMVSNTIVWIISLASIKLFIVGIFISLVLFIMIIAVQLVTYIGKSSKVIYTMPIIYIIGQLLNIWIIIKVFIK